MLNKLHNSVIALTLLLGLAGTPKIATSSELKNISRITIAQNSTEEITPQATDEERGASWYWLLLLLIPLGLGGLLLARRTQSDAEVNERDRVYSTTHANTPTTIADNSLFPLDSNQIANADRSSDNTTTANRLEDETILTTGLTAYDIVGERQTRHRDEVAENESIILDNGDRQSDVPTDQSQATTISDDLDRNLENRDPGLEDLSSESETSLGSNSEISLEEITFEDLSEDLAREAEEDDGIFDWLESLDDSENDGNLDDISEWLNDLDNAEPDRDSHQLLVKTIDCEPNRSSSSSTNEKTSKSDEDIFRELEDMLNEDLQRRKEQ
ncbi:hypothetical protein [Myxosarcina sp. GI1(2024)]